MFKNYSSVFITLLSILLLVLLTIFSGSFFFGKTREIMSQIKQTQSKLEIVESKIAILESATVDVKDFVNIAAFAVPEKNPSLVAASQIRELASANNILLDAFLIFPQSQSFSSEDGQISTHQISFTAASAEYIDIIEFIRSLSRLLPLLKIESIEIKEKSLEGFEAEIKLNVFSAPYPNNLTLIDEPLAGLSGSEQEILAVLESYDTPEIKSDREDFVNIQPRENPFLLSN